MKVVQINGGVFGSTGKIMFGIAEIARTKDIDVICASPVTVTNRKQQPKEYYIKLGSFWGRRVNVLLSRLTGLNGQFAVFTTYKFIKKLKQISPDIIHLHNLHDSYINLPMLFRYIKNSDVKVVWTLHDCWAFTGHCPHFMYEQCDKWKDGCYACPKYKSYPQSYFDNSKLMWKKKKKWFTGLENLTIVTPSKWLANLVRESYLRDYPVSVINNGIDLTVFRPTESDFKSKYNLHDKKIVLGVSFGWGERKGIDIFIELAKRLSREYVIVLVGTDGYTEKILPDSIISIRATNNQKELAEIYTAANVFVNPTREDNYPTVNLEAIACGTPVVTFDVGGSAEMIGRETGYAVDCDDIDSLEREIINACRTSFAVSEKREVLDQEIRHLEYIKLYENLR